MKTDFLKSLGLSNDVIAKIQSESGKAITAEKKKTKTFELLCNKLQEKINSLERLKNEKTMQTLEDKIEQLQNTIVEKKADEEKLVLKTELQKRFDFVTANMKFANKFTKEGLFCEFSRAIESESNQGKSDVEILTDLIKNHSGIFNEPNSTINTSTIDLYISFLNSIKNLSNT